MRILSLPTVICKSEMGEYPDYSSININHIFYPLLKILDICIACTYLYNIVHYYYPKNHQMGETSLLIPEFIISRKISGQCTHTHT